MTTTTTIRVYIHCCSSCSMEIYGFSGTKPVDECPRCGRGFMPVRIVNDPAPEVIERAKRDSHPDSHPA